MEKPIRGDRADLLTRYANPVATGQPCLPCVQMEKLKHQSDFIFYVDPLLCFPIFIEMWYEERMPVGMIVIFPSGSTHLSAPCFVLEADLLCPMQADSLTFWLPGDLGQWEGLRKQNTEREVGVFVSFLPLRLRISVVAFLQQGRRSSRMVFSFSCRCRSHHVAVNAPHVQLQADSITTSMPKDKEEGASSCPVSLFSALSPLQQSNYGFESAFCFLLGL